MYISVVLLEAVRPSQQWGKCELVGINKTNCENYLQCLSESILQGSFEQLDNMLNDSHTDVTTIVSDFETRLLECSEIFKKVRRPFVHKRNKPWFDRDGKQLLYCLTLQNISI